MKVSKLDVRERINCLVDHGTFNEISAEVLPRIKSTNNEKTLRGDGVVTGYGTVDGRLVFIYAQDPNVLSGSIGIKHAEKIYNIIKMGNKSGSPVIGILDTAGARVNEGVDVLNAYGMIYKAHQEATGHIPQITAVLGPCAGGASLIPSLNDFVFTVRNLTEMFLSLPFDVANFSGESLEPEMLGGADIHQQTTGIAHYVDNNEEECLTRIRHLLSFLPSNNLDEVQHNNMLESVEDLDKLEVVIGSDSMEGRELIDSLFDSADFCEWNNNYGTSIITGFARIECKTVGIVANQEQDDGLYITSSGAQKSSMFINYCEAFNIPIITLVNTEGFKPSSEEAYSGIIKQVSNMVFAYSKATVPKITIYTGLAYGSSLVAMGSKSIGSDFTFAWDCAKMGHINPEAVAYFDGCAGQENKSWESRLDNAKEKFDSPTGVAEAGLVDAIISPDETLVAIINSLNILHGKRALENK